MKKYIFLALLCPFFVFSQKKPLDHSVYDNWERIGEKHISNNGQWAVYNILPQEGDAQLIVQSLKNSESKDTISRGSNAHILPDNQFLVFKIKPEFKKTRQAKIDKTPAKDRPKDSLGIMDLSNFKTAKFDSIQSFQVAKESGNWIAYQKFPPKSRKGADKKTKSLEYKIDSLKSVIKELKGENVAFPEREVDSTDTPAKVDNGDLVLYNVKTGEKLVFPEVETYQFDKKGEQIAFSQKNITSDTIRNSAVLLYSFNSQKLDTILKDINTAKSFTFSEEGKHLAFLTESDDKSEVKPKIFQLYLYNRGGGQAQLVANQYSSKIPANFSVSEHGQVQFSKDEDKLFFGTAPIPADKDTSLIDIDLVKIDIWNYKDDYLQPYQLKNLNREKKRSYLAYYDLNSKDIHQLATEGLPTILKIDEGNSPNFIGITDTNRRIASQWTGNTLKDIYLINSQTKQQEQIQKNFSGQTYASPKGKFILFYDSQKRDYFTYDIEDKQYRNISKNIKAPIYQEDDDHPMDPYPYGIMAWSENDEAVYIYDKYDIWKVDPQAKGKPRRITPNGRKHKLIYRYRKTDPEERFVTDNQNLLFHIFNDETKEATLATADLEKKLSFITLSSGDYSYSTYILKAKDSDNLLYTKESFTQSPDLYQYTHQKEEQLSHINPQQKNYNWGTAELFNWKTFKGKESIGIVYKPEDFNPDKKYPAILYFYEKRSNSLNDYMAPAPTPSKLDITFFVSQGYVVFVPDIEYTVGHPGQSAYDYIVSGAEALAKNKWIDKDHMGIQGQSWGGYQVAYLITQTDLFKAAWAGAPVVNMFSAYGGIRWGSGMNRQFQYERTQSRIGGTIWEVPDLYKENSPLFEMPKVNTPVVIMHNDNDGAVPWYQGIEMFTALKRLGKPSWLLNYNGDEHNLMIRKNRKDIQIRELQFFDYLLKGKKPAKWISKGVPATEKGIDWGLEVND